jgi:hypothetical protein
LIRRQITDPSTTIPASGLLSAHGIRPSAAGFVRVLFAVSRQVRRPTWYFPEEQRLADHFKAWCLKDAVPHAKL